MGIGMCKLPAKVQIVTLLAAQAIQSLHHCSIPCKQWSGCVPRKHYLVHRLWFASPC